jgi:tripartite-type tricarboxylate transporter receptor subunit TctC
VNNPQENVGQWRAGAVRPLCVFAPARLAYTDAVTPKQSWADVPTCMEAGLPIERFQMPRTVWLPRGVTDEQVAFYRGLLARVRETDEWKAWLRRGSQTDAFLSGAELDAYLASDERWLRERFAEDGWLLD